MWLAPLIGLALYLLPIPVSSEAHRMLFIVGVATTLWISEAVPLAVTALLVAVLVILCGIAPPADVFSIFADPILFVFIGSFILAEAMQVHGLDRRFAQNILHHRWVRGSAGRMIFIFCCIGFAISMWVSNTATTAMLFPIALSMIRAFPENDRPRIAPLILLMTSFAPSIGGMGTPVGTPPNLIGLAFIRNFSHEEIPFFQWMKFAVPISAAIFLAIYFVLRMFHSKQTLSAPLEDLPAEEFDPDTRKAHRNILIAFGVTVLLWLLPGLAAARGMETAWLDSHLPESVAALIGAILLFVLPVDRKRRRFTITWKEAQNINWGIILLFGGGLVIGKFLFKTGVAKYMGESIVAIYPFHGEFMYLLLFTILAVFISEFTSNTASANLILPVCVAVCQAAGIGTLRPALAATLASSLGFMLPISTAPNAIVFSSRMVPMGLMIRYGVILDLVGATLVAVGVYLLV